MQSENPDSVHCKKKRNNTAIKIRAYLVVTFCSTSRFYTSTRHLKNLITQLVWLVLSYDLQEDRRMDDVIIDNFSRLFFLT